MTTTNPYLTTDDTTARYERALAAEPALHTAVRLVDALCALAGPDDELCYGCAWELLLKPYVTPLVGWCRGLPPDQANDLPPDWKPGDRRPWRFINLAELFARHRDPDPAANDTEAWLRTSEAYDAVTSVLVGRLWDADPGNGCGIRRGST